jgi:putative ABC transport system substrate-binding protein
LTGSAPGRPQAEEAFHQGLREAGYIEGQNLVIEYRRAEDDIGRLPGQAAELVALSVDLIFAPNTPAIVAAQQATRTIPIVMAVAADPIGSGFIDSLAHPGGNITGTTQSASQLAAKRLELLKAVVPMAERMMVLWNPADVATPRQWAETQDAAALLGVQLQSLEVVDLNRLDTALDAVDVHSVDALVALSDRTVMNNRGRIVDFSASSRLPAMYTERDFVDAGGLMSYGPSFAGLWRRAAYYVDRILKGAKPADLPVEQPREFDFIINLKSAQRLGLTIPRHVLLQATEIIQ